MPGQRRRRLREQATRRRRAERFSSDAGRWEVLFETQDPSRFRSRMRRMRAEGVSIDWSATRIDTFCGRLRAPTTYRLSVFLPGPPIGPDPGPGR